MNYEQCMLAILANPEDDAPRRQLAQIMRSQDPELSEFIERQLEMTARIRATNGRPGVGTVGGVTWEESELISKNKRRWTQNLDFYMGELPIHRWVEFHRGLPSLCSMNAYTFLEQGEYIMTRVAPLRGIQFYPDPDGSRFPAKEVAASPLLERLDEIQFFRHTLGEHDLEIIAESPHLKRIVAMDIRQNPVTMEAWERFAANPDTRKCLSIRSDFEVPSDEGPMRECSARFDIYPDRWFACSKEGRELERKYGYLPWLHLVNICNPPDAHYWIENHVLPKYVPGSPADAPTPYGAGLRPERTFEPREKFDVRDYNSVW